MPCFFDTLHKGYWYTRQIRRRSCVLRTRGIKRFNRLGNWYRFPQNDTCYTLGVRATTGVTNSLWEPYGVVPFYLKSVRFPYRTR